MLFCSCNVCITCYYFAGWLVQWTDLSLGIEPSVMITCIWYPRRFRNDFVMYRNLRIFSQCELGDHLTLEISTYEKSGHEYTSTEITTRDFTKSWFCSPMRYVGCFIEFILLVQFRSHAAILFQWSSIVYYECIGQSFIAWIDHEPIRSQEARLRFIFKSRWSGRANKTPVCDHNPINLLSKTLCQRIDDSDGTLRDNT